jgi:hypothetical protein
VTWFHCSGPARPRRTRQVLGRLFFATLTLKIRSRLLARLHFAWPRTAFGARIEPEPSGGSGPLARTCPCRGTRFVVS